MNLTRDQLLKCYEGLEKVAACTPRFIAVNSLSKINIHPL
jgi:hypothetical protein